MILTHAFLFYLNRFLFCSSFGNLWNYGCWPSHAISFQTAPLDRGCPSERTTARRWFSWTLATHPSSALCFQYVATRPVPGEATVNELRFRPVRQVCVWDGAPHLCDATTPSSSTLAWMWPAEAFCALCCWVRLCDLNASRALCWQFRVHLNRFEVFPVESSWLTHSGCCFVDSTCTPTSSCDRLSPSWSTQFRSWVIHCGHNRSGRVCHAS